MALCCFRADCALESDFAVRGTAASESLRSGPFLLSSCSFSVADRVHVQDPYESGQLLLHPRGEAECVAHRAQESRCQHVFGLKQMKSVVIDPLCSVVMLKQSLRKAFVPPEPV